MDEVDPQAAFGRILLIGPLGRKARPHPMSEMEGYMPTYEYRCRDCHNLFDRVEPLAEHGKTRPECPKCKSKKVEQVFTSFFAKTSHKS
jgi:putative FmdB family regulatory protein